MTTLFLRSGNIDDYQPTGDQGQRVFDAALQIRETLRLRQQHAIAACLAIPSLDENNNRVDWYAPVSGDVVRWAAASQAQRQAALECLEHCAQAIESHAQQCAQSANRALQLFGALLRQALHFPGSHFLYLVGGKPVITFWGFTAADQSTPPPPLEQLRADSHMIEPPAPVEIPVPAADIRPVLAPLDARKKSWLIPVLIVAVVGVYGWMQTSPRPSSTAVPAPAPLQHQPPMVAVNLPLEQASVTVAPKPEPAVVSVDKNALTLPPDALKAGSTKFLTGLWKLSLTSPPDNARVASLRYQMKGSSGTARLVSPKKAVCKAELYAGLHQNGVLMIKSRSAARCTNGERIPLPDIACHSGENHLALCTAVYGKVSETPVTLKKVSQ